MWPRVRGFLRVNARRSSVKTGNKSKHRTGGAMDRQRPRGSHSALATFPVPPVEKTRLLFVDNQVRDFLRYRIVLACRLREVGFDVHVALPQEEDLENISRQGIPFHTFYVKRKSTRLVDETRSLASLCRLYRQLRPTLVHHVCLKPALYGGIAARIAGVPAVTSTLTGLGYLFTTQTLKMRLLRLIVLRGLRFSFGHQNARVIFQNRQP